MLEAIPGRFKAASRWEAAYWAWTVIFTYIWGWLTWGPRDGIYGSPSRWTGGTGWIVRRWLDRGAVGKAME